MVEGCGWLKGRYQIQAIPLADSVEVFEGLTLTFGSVNFRQQMTFHKVEFSIQRVTQLEATSIWTDADDPILLEIPQQGKSNVL